MKTINQPSNIIKTIMESSPLQIEINNNQMIIDENESSSDEEDFHNEPSK